MSDQMTYDLSQATEGSPNVFIQWKFINNRYEPTFQLQPIYGLPKCVSTNSNDYDFDC